MTDRAFAAQLAEDIGPAGLRMVADAFHGDLARLLAVLAAACGAGDLAGFRRAAHGLAGAAGAVGATALERACRMAMTATGDLPVLLAAIEAGADAARCDVAWMLSEFGATG